MNIPDDLHRVNPGDRRKATDTRYRIHWRQRWRQWIDRRLPASREITLNQRNVFIFPTPAGFAFIGFLFIVLLVAINFENSPVYALTFLLFGIFVVSILHTFSNLSGITLTAAHSEPAFTGRDATFHVVLSKRGSRTYQCLQLSWQENTPVWVSLIDKHEEWIALRYRTGPRGYCDPGRLKVETRYPIGLLRAWTWVDLDMQTVVYPHPVAAGHLPHTAMISHDSGHVEQPGSDDFYGLRDYQPGDTIKSVAWKNYAKTGQLSAKQFIDPVDHRLWLRWDDTQGEQEQRLSQLCYWALEAERGHSEYGLDIPSARLSPSRGQHHLHELLRALALYNVVNTRNSFKALDKSGPNSSAGERDVGLATQ